MTSKVGFRAKGKGLVHVTAGSLDELNEGLDLNHWTPFHGRQSMATKSIIVQLRLLWNVC
jgi:hypothetical protein